MNFVAPPQSTSQNDTLAAKPAARPAPGPAPTRPSPGQASAQAAPQPGAAGKAAAAAPGNNGPRSGPGKAKAADFNGALSRDEMLVLRKVLGSGMDGFSRQGDVLELHKRMSERFDRLPKQLAEAGTGDLAALSARLDTLETSLNGLEGALRIELAPYLCTALEDLLAGRTEAPARRRWPWLAGVVLAAVAGLAIGVALHGAILTLASGLLPVSGV